MKLFFGSRNFFFSLFLLLSSYFALSSPELKHFHKSILKQQRESNSIRRYYPNLGPLFEEAVLVSLLEEEKYDPERHLILQNVKYYYDNKNNEGELDFVIVDKSQKKVISIIEVKCCWDIKSASRKARKQLGRFRRLILAQKNPRAHTPVISFEYEGKELFELNSKHFFHKPNLRIITYKDELAKEYGFETININYCDLVELRSSMLLIAS